MATYFIDIFDLLFNGGDGCELRTDLPKNDYIKVTCEYDIARDDDRWTLYYKGILLGATWGLTTGTLDDILNGLRGKGRLYDWDWMFGAIYTPFTPDEERVIRRLGLWVF